MRGKGGCVNGFVCLRACTLHTCMGCGGWVASRLIDPLAHDAPAAHFQQVLHTYTICPHHLSHVHGLWCACAGSSLPWCMMCRLRAVRRCRVVKCPPLWMIWTMRWATATIVYTSPMTKRVCVCVCVCVWHCILLFVCVVCVCVYVCGEVPPTVYIKDGEVCVCDCVCVE